METRRLAAMAMAMVFGLGELGCGTKSCSDCLTVDNSVCEQSGGTWAFSMAQVEDAGLTAAPCQTACELLEGTILTQVGAATGAAACAFVPPPLYPDGGAELSWQGTPFSWAVTCGGVTDPVPPIQFLPSAATPATYENNCHLACLDVAGYFADGGLDPMVSSGSASESPSVTYSCSSVGYTTNVVVNGDGWLPVSDGGGPGLACLGEVTSTCAAENPFNGWDGV
jgi:hypothetical protein